MVLVESKYDSLIQPIILYQPGIVGKKKYFNFQTFDKKKYFGNYTLNYKKNLAMLDNQKCVACKFCFTEQSNETNSLEP